MVTHTKFPNITRCNVKQRQIISSWKPLVQCNLHTENRLISQTQRLRHQGRCSSSNCHYIEYRWGNPDQRQEFSWKHTKIMFYRIFPSGWEMMITATIFWAFYYTWNTLLSDLIFTTNLQSWVLLRRLWSTSAWILETNELFESWTTSMALGKLLSSLCLSFLIYKMGIISQCCCGD